MENKQQVEKFNSGKAFEEFIANKLDGVWDGREYHPDVILSNGEIVECKFFTIKPATRANNAIYNYSNGFKLKVLAVNEDGTFTFDKSNLKEQLKNYCSKFDKLAIGWGDIKKGDFDYEIINSQEAYSWLLPRLTANGKDKIRFAYAESSSKNGGAMSRYNTLLKNGFTL